MKINLLKNINRKHVEPLLPRNIMMETKSILKGIGDINDICMKEYMSWLENEGRHQGPHNDRCGDTIA